MIRKVAIVTVLVLAAVLVGAVASGALSAATGERTTTVTVVSDEDGSLRLVDGHAGGLIRQTGTGSLEIDFTLGGGSGATVGTAFRFGSEGSPTSNHAFRIVNRGSQRVSIEVSYTLAAGASDGEPGQRNVEFSLHLDRGDDGSIDASKTTGENDAGATLSNVGVGDVIYAVITVDTEGLSGSSDLTGTLEVTAEQ